MALSVAVRRLSRLPGRGERQVQLSFRGFTQKTRKVRCGAEAVFGELFRWPHYGKLIMGETLSIKVYNCSKVFSNREGSQTERDWVRKCKALPVGVYQDGNDGHVTVPWKLD